LEEAGTEGVNPEKILQDIQARDERDQNRSAAPLIPAADALVLDSTQMSITEVHNSIMAEATSRKLLAAGEN